MPWASWSIVAGFALLAYLAGSIPFGLLLTKARGHGDIRALGSGNIGATNVLRTGDKPLAAATLFCDIVKGFLPVLIARRFGPHAAAAAAIAAPLGHIFPIWLRFKGGKGVATAGGALLAYAWPAALAAVATWFAIAIVFRYSSLAALAAAASAPLYAWLLLRQPGPAAVVLVIALVVIARHRDNLARLLRGKESKIELRKRRA
ncbi:MAG: glycerol-3-phosphate 1-O-acyltransferase PlsY [Stellaceae bacterium]